MTEAPRTKTTFDERVERAWKVDSSTRVSPSHRETYLYRSQRPIIALSIDGRESPRGKASHTCCQLQVFPECNVPNWTDPIRGSQVSLRQQVHLEALWDSEKVVTSPSRTSEGFHELFRCRLRATKGARGQSKGRGRRLRLGILQLGCSSILKSSGRANKRGSSSSGRIGSARHPPPPTLNNIFHATRRFDSLSFLPEAI